MASRSIVCCFWIILSSQFFIYAWSSTPDFHFNQPEEKRTSPFSPQTVDGFDDPRLSVREMGLFEDTEMVPMRDGVRLSSTIYKPVLGMPWPAILIRTPYGKGSFSEMQALAYLAGYAIIVQDMRGRFDSEGEDRVFQTDGWGELQDGYDTIEWIARQSWCNGKVGMWGPSALGIVQGLAAGAVPPHLVCQVIGYAAAKGYGHAAYQCGVFRLELVDKWLNKHGMGHMYPEFLRHPTEDDFWKQYDIESRHHLINVPSLFIGGFYDCFEQGTLDDFVGRQTNGAPGAQGRQQLIMGPWTHTNEFDTTQGQLSFPLNSIFIDQVQTTLKWFNYWLKDEQNGVRDNPTVQYYVMGDVTDPNAPGNEWRTAEMWPPESREIAFYLNSDHSLSIVVPSVEEQVDSFVLDPNHPCPTIGGKNLEIAAGPYDQSDLEARNDVLVFSTEPLPEPLEVVGRIRAVLFAASNLTDNDLTVRLTDVYPNGRSMLVCDGIARASFRDSFVESTPITPGDVYRYEVDLWSTSLVFNRGHRIRIIIANTNYPRFDLNPQYKQLGQHGLPDFVETVLHFSRTYPSHLLLPVTAGDVFVKDWNRY
ncbi:MAG: CocE/NonD family hydrolase [Candidatus Omnitrophota bacterium]|jgi:predicted acyl esterase|nr:MAG: CocE/NonD family hydrolase [Candidatus Omnitrophota bacterium]